MVYTDIQTLGGLTKPADYGSGVEYANGLIEIFHNQSVAMQVRKPVTAHNMLANAKIHSHTLVATRLAFGFLELLGVETSRMAILMISWMH